MMLHLPLYLPVIFILTTLLTLAFFYKASRYSKPTLFILLVWIMVQGTVSYIGFYTNTYAMPPRFALLIGPPLLVIIFLFVTKKGRGYLDGFDARTLTYLHAVRVPVEMVLLGLSVWGAIPELMTFEGRNFDVFSGITAPFVAYLGYRTQRRNKALLLAWNFICLGLLFNIVIHAILSAPTPFQQMAFEQPNIAVFYFPFVWLPCCVVPLVLLSHLVSIRQLIRHKNTAGWFLIFLTGVFNLYTSVLVKYT